MDCLGKRLLEIVVVNDEKTGVLLEKPKGSNRTKIETAFKLVGNVETGIAVQDWLVLA